MKPENIPDNSADNAACERACALLSDYADNALPARQTWELEKHFADCVDCAAQAKQMKMLANALHTAPTFATGDDFMARLHARLDTLEQEPARTMAPTLHERFAGWRGFLRVRPLPALSAGMAFAALLVSVVMYQGRSLAPVLPAPPLAHAAGETFRQQLHSNVALMANDPLQDAAAANLEAHAAAQDSAAAPLAE